MRRNYEVFRKSEAEDGVSVFGLGHCVDGCTTSEMESIESDAIFRMGRVKGKR